MDIRAAEISAILKDQIENFGAETDVAEVGQVLSDCGANCSSSTCNRHPFGSPCHCTVAASESARRRFSFSGYPYVEMTLDVGPKAPLGLNSPPMVINRPDGEWDVPGPMEGGAAGMDVAAND